MEDTTMLDGSAPLFEGLTFVLIPNALPEARLQQLTDDIVASGGSIHPFNPSIGRISDFDQVTHIVSTTSDFPDYHNALDQFKNVVKPTWVDACLEGGKLKNTRVYSPDPALFLSEVVVCCGNIPEGDKEAIEGGVVAMGGQYVPVLSKQVTHLIALDMSDPRVQLATDKRLRCLVLLPHWFDDCLKLGRKIAERPYTLPNPEILNVEAGALPATRPSPQIRDASNPQPVNEPAPPTPPPEAEPPRGIRAFDNKKVMLSDDLQLSDRLKGIITEMIKAGGGALTTNVDQTDIYVCNYREGSDYVQASQAGKDVGNLSWLYYMLTHDTWTNPMRRMLHYPRPRDGIPKFEGYKISISSYTGEARVYLENLVKATGAEFTKTFKQDNTHLITAHMQSEKCEAAKEWGVHIVNHLWIEESYARCKEQTLTDSRYNFFPQRTNLGEILGQTELDRNAVEKRYYPKVQAKAPKPKATKPSGQPDIPTSSGPKGRAATEVATHSSPSVEKNTRGKSGGNTGTPARRESDKENDTPGTGRSAKAQALSKLHDSASDIAKFEKEMKRKGGVVHGGRRDKEAEVADTSKKNKSRDSNTSKRSFEEMDVDDESIVDELSDESSQKNKKAKKEKVTPKFKVMITKYERWSNNSDAESKDKAKLRELGLQIMGDGMEIKNVDLLIAPSVVRTKKFVSALACGPTVVSTSYLDYALKQNKLPPPEKHILHDSSFEKQRGFRISEAVERAKQNKQRLLKDWAIFCTDKVVGGFDTFKDITAANGGKCMLWKGRTTSLNPSKRTLDSEDQEVSQNQEEDEGDVLYLISDPNKKEFELWKKFRALAKQHNMTPRIVTTEWLLFVAMAQYVHWDPKWELNEEMVNSMKS